MAHKHGEMDATQNENTFAGFVTALIRTTIFILIAVILLALIGA